MDDNLSTARAASSKRWLWEALGALFCLLLLAGVWTWGERRTERALEREARAADETLKRRVQDDDAKLSAARKAAEDWSQALVASEAQAVFRAFVAAVHPAVLSERVDTVDAAVGGLLQLPGIAFVHVFRPDGTVVSSSDRKFMTTRSMGDDATWAAAAEALTARAGTVPGTLELAAPLQGGAGRMAIVWMGYNVEAVRAQSRPPEPR